MRTTACWCAQLAAACCPPTAGPPASAADTSPMRAKVDSSTT